MKRLLLIVLCIGILGIGVGAYAGIVPFLSPLVAGPIDLGVKNDPARVAAFNTRLSMKNTLPGGVVPADREPQYEGNIHIDERFTSEDITSILAYWKQQYAKTPIRNVQVKFNEDGTGEISGILETTTAVALARSLGYTDNQIDAAKQYVKFISGDLPFYAKGVAGVTNGNVTISPTTLQVGRISLPEALVAPVSNAIEDTIERRIAKIPRAAISSVTIENGKIHVVGDIPDTVK